MVKKARSSKSYPRDFTSAQKRDGFLAPLGAYAFAVAFTVAASKIYWSELSQAEASPSGLTDFALGYAAIFALLSFGWIVGWTFALLLTGIPSLFFRVTCAAWLVISTYVASTVTYALAADGSLGVQALAMVPTLIVFTALCWVSYVMFVTPQEPRKKKVARRSSLVIPAAEGSARLSQIKKFGDEATEWTEENVIPRPKGD